MENPSYKVHYIRKSSCRQTAFFQCDSPKMGYHCIIMGYRRVAMSRRKLIESYYENGEKQSLRNVANKLGIAPNTARNWLIRFGIYDSQRKKQQ